MAWTLRAWCVMFGGTIPGRPCCCFPGTLSWFSVAIVGLVGPAGAVCTCTGLPGQPSAASLHLALRNPGRPGAGGGSLRTVRWIGACPATFRRDVLLPLPRKVGPYCRLGPWYVHVGHALGRQHQLLSYVSPACRGALVYPSELSSGLLRTFSAIAVPWLTYPPSHRHRAGLFRQGEVRAVPPAALPLGGASCDRVAINHLSALIEESWRLSLRSA